MTSILGAIEQTAVAWHIQKYVFRTPKPSATGMFLEVEAKTKLVEKGRRMRHYKYCAPRSTPCSGAGSAKRIA